MARYLLIESRDPFEWGEVEHQYDLARGLAEGGNEVTLFLVQNGVLPARGASRGSRLGALARAGVEVLADDFSLAERGIATAALAGGVRAAPLDVVIDGLAAGHTVVWH